MPFERTFFLQPTLSVAKKLLGTKLTTFQRGVVTSGMIVEVEGYLGNGDPASHSYKERTPLYFI